MKIMDLATENRVTQRLSIGAAWEQKQYATVLSRLKNDSAFPEGFKLEELDEKDDAQRSLKVFVQERNRLHEWIKNDQLEEVKDFTSKNQSKYFFNVKSESAAFTALYNRNFKIYAYLQKIRVKLAEHERHEIDKLDFKDKHELREVLLSYFPTDEKSHIYHLISRIKINSEKPLAQCRDQLFNYLEKLNEIPSVSIILKVIQYVERLDVVLDLDDENVKTICPSASTDERGLTFRHLSTIYVAAGGNRTENEILGTLAHELTHMAMHEVFKNDCKPYYKSDRVGQKEFRTITATIENSVQGISNTPSETLRGAFTYYYTRTRQWESELIARVPHILAQYPQGKDWLSRKVSQLFQFFNDKVIPECEKYISQSFLSKAKSLNRSLNENKGEIVNIKKSSLKFDNINEIRNFLNTPNKNIFALITKYTWFGLLRVLQAAYDADYVELCDRFLVFKLQSFIKNVTEVEYQFNSEATEMLFIECYVNIQNEVKTLSGIEKIMKIVKVKKDKKIILVMREDGSDHIAKLVETCGLKEMFLTQNDGECSLYDLSEESRKKVLDSKILFQGSECNLSELINNDEDLFKCINAEVLKGILSGKTIKIGSKPFGTSSLDGAYADIVHSADLGALIDEINNSGDYFLISGNNNPNRKEELFKFLNERINVSLMTELEKFDVEISGNKRVFIIDESLQNKDFRSFCSFNSKKKIYHLKEEDSYFVLQKIFNPDFYFERQFKRYNVIIKKKLFDPDNLKKIPDCFIIAIDGKQHIKHTFDPLKIKVVEEDKIENALQEFRQSEATIHVLKSENNQLTCIKSCGSSSRLKEWIDWSRSKEKIVESENLLVSKIKKEAVIILADDPGMGKSTSLTKLYENEQISSCHWVIRINIKDHVKLIKNLKYILDVSDIVTFLTKIDRKLKSYTTKRFLEAAMGIDKKFGKNLLLCFDGFDELLDSQDREKMINLFRFLQINTKCKVWITTRLHYKEILEEKLSVFSVRFEPIADLSKENFIKNYLKNRIKLVINQEKYKEVFGSNNEEKSGRNLKNFAEHFLAKTNEIFQKDLERFIGTPLQINLLLENSIPSFRIFIENLGNVDFSYLGNNLVEVYQNFFDRKYDIYCKKRNLVVEADKQTMKNRLEYWHEILAYSLLTNGELENGFNEKKPQMLLLGMTKDEGENIEFIHFTFREYFFVQSLINYLKKNDPKESDCKQFQKFFMVEILTEKKYELMRKFINGHLEKKEVKELLQDKTHKEFLKKSMNYLSHFKAVCENNNNILDFLFAFNYSPPIYKRIFKRLSFPQKIIFGSSVSLLHLAIERKNDSAVTTIVELASKYNFDQQLLSVVNKYQNTAFHLAVAEKNNFAANQIIEIALKYNSVQELLTTVDLFKDTAFHLAVKKKNEFAVNRIIQLASIINFNPHLLHAVNGNRNTAFYLAIIEENNFAFNRIIELASNGELNKLLISSVEKDKRTALHLAVKHKNDFAVNQIIDLAYKNNFDHPILAAVNEYGDTAFHLATKGKNDFAVNRIIELALKHKIHQHLLTAVNKNKKTAFDLAVREKNGFAVWRIIELASKYHLDQNLLDAVKSSEDRAFCLASVEGRESTWL